MLRQTMLLALTAALIGNSTAAWADARKFGIEVAQGEKGGVRIKAVRPQSTAALLGLQPEYFIVALGDLPINDQATLDKALTQTPAGVWRSIAYVAHGRLELGLYTVSSQQEPASLPPLGRIGVLLADHHRGVRGARVDEVNPGGSAGRQGIQAGDLIVEIGNRAVTGADVVVHEVANRRGERVSMTIYRSGRYIRGYVVPTSDTQMGALEVKPKAAPTEHASHGRRGDGWCDENGVRTAICTTAAIIVVGTLFALLKDDTGMPGTRPTDAERESARARDRQIQQSFERAIDDQARREGRLPN